MIRALYNQVKDGQEVRKSLIALRAELKENKNLQAFRYYLAGDYTVLLELLSDEDAKVRKNVALVLGCLGNKEFLNPLFDGYEQEKTLFVRSAYLIAIRELDYRSVLPKIKKIKLQLEENQIKEEEKKHRNEEISLLTELVIAVEGQKTHTFTGYDVPNKIILLTNRNFKKITLEQLEEETAKTFQAGVLLRTENLKKVLTIRTYQEILFLLEGRTSVSRQPKEASQQLIESGIVQYLEERHKEDAPFYFRIEIKGKMDLKEKGNLIKKLAAELEEKTKRRLINSGSHYEIEFRLVENKEGTFHFFLKFYTIEDIRFSYRQEVSAASMRPANAALVVALAKPYLKEKANVLDPFCGVGTLLIERHKAIEAGSLYGVDIFGKTIEKARVNTEIAHMIVHYINRDFFQFKHEYLFDEIITDMPMAKGIEKELELKQLYKRFFLKAKEHLHEGGIMVIYTHNKSWIEQYVSKDWYTILECFEISKLEGTYLYIIKKK